MTLNYGPNTPMLHSSSSSSSSSSSGSNLNMGQGSTSTTNSRVHPEDLEAEIAFRYAVQRINRDRNILPNTTLIYEIQYVAKDDSFHAAKKGFLLIIFFLIDIY